MHQSFVTMIPPLPGNSRDFDFHPESLKKPCIMGKNSGQKECYLALQSVMLFCHSYFWSPAFCANQQLAKALLFGPALCCFSATAILPNTKPRPFPSTVEQCKCKNMAHFYPVLLLSSNLLGKRGGEVGYKPLVEGSWCGNGWLVHKNLTVSEFYPSRMT